MPQRLARLELVVGIDPSGGGGLAAQIEQLTEKIDDAQEQRQQQHASLLVTLTELTVAVKELPHTVRGELAEVKSALDRRIYALELGRSLPLPPP